MAGLHVQLDVEYASDEAVLEVDGLAELLFIRAMCWCKKNPKTNGSFTWAQMGTFANKITSTRKRADQLAAVGLFEITSNGARIVGWLKRNKSGEDIAAAQEMASALGIQGNHDRWHTGPEGKPSTKCPLCVTAHRSGKASGTPIGSRSGAPIRDGSLSKEEEEQVEEETQEEEEKEAAAPTTTDTLGPPPRKPAAAALKMLLDWKVANECRGPEKVYRDNVGPKLKAEWRQALADYLDRHPDADANELAAHVLHVPGISSAQSPVKPLWYADPFCACEGDGWANLAPEGEAAINGPCPCRRPEPYLATVTELRPA